MEINDLIFRELIKRGYSLDGKTRVWNIADSKLWYLTPEQAQAYLDLDNSKEYNKAINKNQSQELMNSNAKLIMNLVGSDAINVVDLGCGDGEKAAELIKAFNGKVKLRYCPIDISGYMVQKAIETFSKEKLGDIVEFQYNISDFENLENITPLLTKGSYRRNLFLLLGNTLGNFEVTDLLYTIRAAMGENDLLLVDTAIADPDILKKTELQSKNRKVEKFLLNIPLQLGLERNDVEYSARFKNSRIEYVFSINRDVQIRFQDKTIYFNKGDQVVVAIAYKHKEEDLKAVFNMYFDRPQMIFSKDGAQAFILCKK